MILIVIAIGMFLSIRGDSSAAESSTTTVQRHESVVRTDLSPEDLYEHVACSVVTIMVKDEDGEAVGTGSGFFIDDALFSERSASLKLDKATAERLRNNGNTVQLGYVLTNYHVIRPAVDADIVLLNGKEGTLWRVLAEDEEADLALLSVFVRSSQSLKTIPLSPNDPRILSTVYAIGSPKGLQGSASEGKVSAYREFDGGDRWLQMTTPISPGSSGSPLLLSNGTLAGVTTMFRMDAQNLNFAIPVSAVQKFLVTAEICPRDIAEGASIKWSVESAFSDLRIAIELGQYTDAEKYALEFLEKAEGGRLGLPSGRAVEISHAVGNSLPDELKSLPDEFEYLAHYVIGQAHWWAAVQAVNASNPNHQFTQAEFASRYRSNTHASSALHHLTKTTRLRSEFAPAYHELITHYELSRDRANALVAASALVDRVPRSASALNIRARCSSELGQPESAKKDLEAAIDLSPKDCVYYGKYADVLVELGEYAEAISAYETAIELENMTSSRMAITSTWE
jgi:S1-C subfamily serine protease